MAFPKELGLDSLRFFLDGPKSIEVLENIGIIPRKPTENQICPKCKMNTLGIENRTNLLGWRYRCTRKMCKKSISSVKNTLLEKAHISPYQIIAIAYYFLEKFKCERMLQNMHIATHTAADYYNFFKEICNWRYRYEMNETGPIGGVGFHVEIDEAYVKRKSGKGRATAMEDKCWKFIGMICAETKEVVGFLIPSTKKKLIWKIIKDWVKPGTILHTDGAKIYENIASEQAKEQGMQFLLHEIVIHKTGELEIKKTNIKMKTLNYRIF